MNVLGKALGSMLCYTFLRSLHTRIETPSTGTSSSVTKYVSIPKLRALCITRPFLASLLVRLTPLPEIGKNYLLSILPVPPSTVLLAVLAHGGPYSVLWSYLGSRARDGEEGGMGGGIKGVLAGMAVAGTAGPLWAVRKYAKPD